MFFYYIPVLLGLLGAIVSPKSSVYLFFCCLSLFILIGFKGEVDKDYLNYLDLFELAPKFSNNFFDEFINYYNEANFEFGFLLLNSICKSLNFGFGVIYLFFSFFSCLAIFYICNLISTNKFFVFIFLYMASFLGLWVQVRFGMASLLAMLAAILWVNKKFYVPILLIFFAVSFHWSVLAVIFPLSLYFLIDRGIFSRRWVVLFVIGISFLFVFIDVKSNLMLLLNVFASRYDAYTDTGNDGGGALIYYYRLFVLLVLLYLTDQLSISDNDTSLDHSSLILFSFSLTSLFFWSLAWQLEILYRIGVFLELGYCFFLLRFRYINSARYVVGISLVSLLFTWRWLASIDELLPYSVIFFTS